MVGKQLELFALGANKARTRVGLTVASLQSGSEGNATLFAGGGSALLVDCGISPARLTRRLEALGRAPGQLSGILVTHEHWDHAGGAGAVARRFGVPIYVTHGTATEMARVILRRDEDRSHVRILPREGVLAFRDGREVFPGEPHDLRVDWIPVPHDAAEPVAFTIERGGVRGAVLTDIGHASKPVRTLFETLDLALLETNHDRDRLRDGPYPRSLKRRIASSLGHLSNVEAARLVRDHGSSRLRHLLLGHLSEVNNAPALAEGAMRSMLERRADLRVDLHLTYRDRPAPPIEA